MSEPKILGLSDNTGNSNNGHSFRLKQIKEDNGEHNNKCTCTRHGDMVTNICPCLDDDSHMPMLKLPERTDDDDRERCSSLTPGWKVIVQDRISGKDENESATTNDLEHLPCVDKDQKIFCTGSCYVGQWNVLGMKGYGTYIMPHGVEYCGEFEDGQFHGSGTLTYPNGIKIRGVFEKGKMIKWDLQFNDGLEYNIPWNYCRMPDRRFYSEIKDSIKPAGCSYITPEKPSREIPKGCYDTGDGYFDPNMKCIYSAYKPNKILRVASKLEEEWILANCRREEDCTTGYRPDLYAKLVTGCDEYTLERNKSTETFDSDEINEDEKRDKYIIAELMDIPSVKNELTSRKFGQNVIETPIYDRTEITDDGTWVKTRDHQQRIPTGQFTMVSKLGPTESNRNETLDKPLSFKSHYEDTTGLDNVAMNVNKTLAIQASQSPLEDSINQCLSQATQSSPIDTENIEYNGDIETLPKSISSSDILSTSGTTDDNCEPENMFSIQDPKELGSLKINAFE